MSRYARVVFLYAPAIVCAAWAAAIWLVGRDDTVIVAGAVALAVALILHTCQSMHDYSQLGRRR